MQPEAQDWSRKESRLQECSLGGIPMGEVDGEDGQAGLSDGESSGGWYPCLYIVTWEQAVPWQPYFLGLVHNLSRDFLGFKRTGFSKSKRQTRQIGHLVAFRPSAGCCVVTLSGQSHASFMTRD